MLDTNFWILVTRNKIYVCVVDTENGNNNGTSAELKDEEESESSVHEDENSEEETSQINSMLLN